MITTYTEQILEWQLGQADAEALPPCVEDADVARRTAQRLLRAAERSGHRHVLVLGVGDGTLATLVMRALGAGCGLLVLEDSPVRARRALRLCPCLSAVMVVDSSPWALLLLCLAGGVARDSCSLVYNPVYSRVAEQGGLSVLEQWRRLFLGVERVEGAAELGAVPSLSVACIAHPEETLLAEFLAQVPPWVAEVVIVWDGAAPERVPPCAVPLRQVVRSLAGDFAGQRNAMLDACTGEWCLYLDVDEALSAATWAAVPRWMALNGRAETGGTGGTGGQDGQLVGTVGAVALPRETFMGDIRHVRMGYGLWPDVQVRLFPLHEGLRFEGAVHEQLKGVRGAYCLAVGHALMHYSHIRKDRASLAARLRVFDAAGQTVGQGGQAAEQVGGQAAEQVGGQLRHVLSAAYPALPVDYFVALRGALGDTLLFLPVM